MSELNSYVQKIFSTIWTNVVKLLILRDVHDLSTLYYAYGETNLTVYNIIIKCFHRAGSPEVLSLVAPPTPRRHVTDRRPGCVESILVLALSWC